MPLAQCILFCPVLNPSDFREFCLKPVCLQTSSRVVNLGILCLSPQRFWLHTYKQEYPWIYLQLTVYLRVLSICFSNLPRIFIFPKGTFGETCFSHPNNYFYFQANALFSEQDLLRDSDYWFLSNSLSLEQLYPFCSFFMGNEKHFNIIMLIR